MLDELLDVLLQPVFDLVPDAVYGFLFILAGAAAAMVGAGIFGESPRLGGFWSVSAC